MVLGYREESNLKVQSSLMKSSTYDSLLSFSFIDIYLFVVRLYTYYVQYTRTRAVDNVAAAPIALLHVGTFVIGIRSQEYFCISCNE